MWIKVIDIIRDKRCMERKRTGRCSCEVKRGKHAGSNPCEYSDRIADGATDRMLGEPSDVTDEDILWLLRHRQCRNGSCNHKRCADLQECIAFVEGLPMIVPS